MNNDSLFELLKTKEIIGILDGDTKFGDYKFDDGQTVNIAMPRLSGPDLCAISTSFGLPVEYHWNGNQNLSRWQYLDNLMMYCLENHRFSDLLAYLFDKKQFQKSLSGHSADEINEAYNKIVCAVLDNINGILSFSKHELSIVGNEFIIHAIGTSITARVPHIKTISRKYIKSISERALDDVEKHNFDSAITKARTLLEETFCFVIEKKGYEPTDSGNIAELFKQVKNLYNMHTDANANRCINTLLSGLNSIVSAIAEMRNKDSDAHGVGAKRISIEEYHARLFVNSAMTMADFILSVSQQPQSL